jgi:competence protein ComEC
VISAGRGNIYGHPAPEAVARLRQSGALVLRTDILGAIKVVFDGRALRWYSYRYQPAFF